MSNAEIKEKNSCKKITKKSWCQPSQIFYTRDSSHETKMTALKKQITKSNP